MRKEQIKYHKDGSIFARGSVINDIPNGYWEWFRKDGTKKRSGYFNKGEQVGEWITYDRQGEPYKVTVIKRSMNQQIVEKLNHHFGKYELTTYGKGETITQANQDPEGVSLLVSGLVEQYDITPEGNKLSVNIFRPPAFFPMSWAMNKTPNAYFFGALTDVELRRADADETVAFLKDNPDVMFDLLARVYRGADVLLRRLVLVANGAATNRLIFELLIEAYRFGVETDNKTIVVTVRQATLASRSGLARETVSREMQKLEQEKLICKTKQGVAINIYGLEQKLAIWA